MKGPNDNKPEDRTGMRGTGHGRRNAASDLLALAVLTLGMASLARAANRAPAPHVHEAAAPVAKVPADAPDVSDARDTPVTLDATGRHPDITSPAALSAPVSPDAGTLSGPPTVPAMPATPGLAGETGTVPYATDYGTPPGVPGAANPRPAAPEAYGTTAFPQTASQGDSFWFVFSTGAMLFLAAAMVLLAGSALVRMRRRAMLPCPACGAPRGVHVGQVGTCRNGFRCLACGFLFDPMDPQTEPPPGPPARPRSRTDAG